MAANRAERRREERNLRGMVGSKVDLDAHVLRLAKRWRNKGRLEAPQYSDPGFDLAYDRQYDEIDRITGDAVAFRKVLFDHACAREAEVVLPDGRPGTAGMRLFFVPAVGDKENIERFRASPEGFGSLAKLFKASGLAHRDSSVVLSNVPVFSGALALSSPGTMSVVAKRFVEAIFGGASPEYMQAIVDRAVHEAFSEDAHAFRIGGTDKLHVAFVGARLVIEPVAESVTDVFSIPYESLFRADSSGTSVSGGGPEAAAWETGAAGIGARFGMGISTPGNRTETLDRVARMAVDAFLRDAAAELGLPEGTRPDAIHHRSKGPYKAIVPVFGGKAYPELAMPLLLPKDEGSFLGFLGALSLGGAEHGPPDLEPGGGHASAS